MRKLYWFHAESGEDYYHIRSCHVKSAENNIIKAIDRGDMVCQRYSYIGLIIVPEDKLKKVSDGIFIDTSYRDTEKST